MKKFVSICIAIILILIIGWVAFGNDLVDRYTYSKERVELPAYFQVTGDQAAIILQDEMLEDKAMIKNGICYFDLGTIHQYFSEVFYADRLEGMLLYTTPTDNIRVNFGDSLVWTSEGSSDLGYIPAYLEGETVYVAADYVKQYVNFSYVMYEQHLQVYTKWDVRQLMAVNKNTALRLLGGIKSPILRDLAMGEQVEILEQMDNWSKVKTSDSYIGYVENKRLSDKTTEIEEPVTDVPEPEYTSLSLSGKVSLGWHSIGGAPGNDTLSSMVSGANGMNVIAPTWFSLNDNEGNFRSFASEAYVEKAHALGLQVWGVLDDFNYNLETGAGIDVYSVLSSTSKRQMLAENIAQTALSFGLDGINVDFERIGADTGPHYIQFLRELSVQCRRNNLILSVDNYVPFHFNDYYRLDIQGQIVDYVIIMGYDEHWHGSGNPGSVASIEYVQNGIAKTLAEVPGSKVVNALPLYTIVWKIDGATVSDEYLTIRNTADYLKQIDAEPVWDEETCQNYVEWTNGDIMYKIWIEDEASIGVKLNVMKSQKIGGVAVWRLGYGTDDIWKLIKNYVDSK